MAKRLLLRDAENLSADMLQRIFGALYGTLPVIAGVGTGYAAGQVGARASTSTGHLAVTADGTDLILTILPGWAQIIRDAGGSTFDPRALFAESDANDSSVTLTSNATGSTRNDTVCMKVDLNSAPTSDGSNLVSFVAIAGQAGGGLSNAPADGNLYLPLANVAVGNGVVLVSQANVTDLRRAFLAPFHPLVVPQAVQGFPPATSYGSLPVLIDRKSGAAATYDFTNISQVFSELEFRFHLRDSTGNVGEGAVAVTLNANATGVYYLERQQIKGTTTIVPAETLAGTNWSLAIAVAGGNGATNLRSAGKLNMPNYAGSDNKTFHAEAAVPVATTTGNQIREEYSGWWNLTAAITEVTFTPTTGFDAGSYCELWGYP